MNSYLVSGPSGSGKTTVGHELSRLGYDVVHMDQEPGISGWFKTATGDSVKMPQHYPVSQVWLDTHSWFWHTSRTQTLINNRATQDTFYVGGAHNEEDFYHLFNKRFSLEVDGPTLIQRLQIRGEGDRWRDSSPETGRLLAQASEHIEHARVSGAIIIDAKRPIEVVTAEVIRHVYDA